MVIEDVYGFPIVQWGINVLEMVCGEKPPFFHPKFLQTRGSISVHSASTCSHLSRNCSSRTLTRRLGLLFDNHCIIILCNYLPPSVQKLLAKNIVEEANSAKW